MRIINCCFIIVLGLHGLVAQSTELPLFRIDKIQETYNLTSHLYFIEDVENAVQVENIQEVIDRFESYSTSTKLDPELSYWAGCRVIVEPEINLTIHNWKLYVGEADYFEVYILDQDYNILNSGRGGEMLPEKEKDLKYGNHEMRIPFNLDPGMEVLLFINYSRINNQRILFDVRIEKYDFHQSWDYLKESRRDWFFLGFIFTMFLLNFMYFILTKSSVFMYHGLFILGVLLFTLDFFGVTADLWLVKDHPKFIQLVDYIALAMIDISYFQFIRKYLNLEVDSPNWDIWFDRILKFKVLFFVAIIGFHYTTFNEPLSDKIIALFLALGFAFTILFITVFYKSKSINQRFVIAGTAILFIAVILNTYSIIQNQGLSTVFTEIGLSLEIVLFSMALAFRLRDLREEENKAKTVLEVAEVKNKFFTNISHEFRTPLTIINGMTELAKDKISSLDTSAVYESLQKIRYQSDKVLNLVNQILGLTKLETKSIDLQLRQIDLIVWLKRIVINYRDYALQKGIDIQFITSEKEYMMDIDDQHLKTVMSNLISNAIKFSKQEGVIEIKCSPALKEGKEGITIEVQDHGNGIEGKHLDKIFDRFYQVDDRRGFGYTGFGVGLSMCKELVELMKGSIEVKSQVNSGSTFSVWLPLSQEAEIRKEESELFTNERESSMFLESAEMNEDAPIILLVDDNADILDYLESLLEKTFIVEKAIDGLEGTKKAMKIIPDLIISDIMMPMKDGFELCDELKKNEKTNHIPIILLTAKADKKDRLTSWQTGADAFLTKPFDKKELFLQINKLQQLRKKLLEKYSTFAFVEDKSKLKKENSFIQTVHKILNENLSNSDFSVEELASKVFMSRMQLHRKIKALSDKSASHYIRSFRLHKAKLLIKDMNNTIGDVAYDVGFQSPNYFSRCFHEEFGMTPSDYKESLQ